jgi:hypothetical protein
MNSSKKLVIALILLFSQVLMAQTTASLSWLKGIGGTTVNDVLNGMHVDGAGNVYIAGRIQDVVDLDPGPGSYTVDLNNEHGFFGKYNSNGNLIWASNLDGEGISEIMAITTDASGNVYIAGEFEMGPLDFNIASPGTNTIAPTDKDIFLAKYTASGAFTWAKAIGSPSATLRVNHLKVNSVGDVVISGYFNQEPAAPVNFNPSGPSFTMQTNGYSDAYIAKYSSTGTLMFATNIGGPKSDYLYGMDVDAADNIYVTGVFKDTVYYGGAAPTNSIVGFGPGFQDMFTAKYASNGSFVWGKAVGGTSDDGGYRLKVINNNEFVISGFMYSPTMDADPSTTAATNLTLMNTSTDFDNLLLKYSSSSGNLIWGKNTSGNGYVLPYILNSDNQGNIYFGGAFQGIVDFDFGTAVQNYTSTVFANKDICLAKYNSTGDFIFNYQFGAASANEAYQACITSSNEIILGGGYSDAVDFDPSPSTNTLTLYGQRDIFFNKYSQCISPDTPTLSIVSNTICANTTATITITAGNLNSATNWVWSQGTCGSSTIAVGNSATVAPTFATTYFVRGEGGCSTPSNCASITISVTSSTDITGLVTTSPSVPVTGSVVIYRYEGPGTLWDYVGFQNINASGNYTFNAVNSGSYIIMCQPIASSLQTTYAPNKISWKGATVFGHGCNTTTNLNIDVQPLTNIGTGPGELSGKITEGVGYGNRGTIVPGNPIGGLNIKGGKNPGGNIVAQGRTNSSGEYTLSGLPINVSGESYFILVDIPGLDTNGTYHMAVQTGSLQYTGLDFIVDSMFINPTTGVGVKELSINDHLVSLYPNPAKDKLTIEIKENTNAKIQYNLIDMFSKVVKEEEFTSINGNFKTQLLLSDLNKGIYFMKIKVNEKEKVIKIVLSE